MKKSFGGNFHLIYNDEVVQCMKVYCDMIGLIVLSTRVKGLCMRYILFVNE